ncbi:MaoC/PaaZ C-terminal domain-containing protein [Actinotalea sp. C106]|uniref:MaoC/PaaZ C-terminal domain-containing protein n=1 Tax=Actinotalea sp. C106 TaxID=2908644 RepID=UPI0020291A09|nr:MaoC/PaaZ C-terminal domain-containing protein [Actinotalea sp. C106]
MRTPEVEVVELDAVPALGGLYARGVAGSARAAATRRRTVRPDDLPSTELVVREVQAEVEHLSAYQHLLGETGGDALPAGFVHVLAFPVATALMVRPGFPLPLLGMVHVANRVEQRRAVRLGEEMDLRVRAQDLHAHRSGVTVDLVAEAWVDEELVWTGTSTYLAKGHHLAPHSASTDPTPLPSPGDLVSEPQGALGIPGSDTRSEERAGRVPTGQWRLAGDVGRRYAAVSGDQNPIHTSALAAKAFGFPRAIAHGMYTAARALADVGPARGEAFVWEVQFAKPVVLPSTVAVRVAQGDGEAEGFSFEAWSPRSGRTHLTGRVSPLG